MAALRTVGLRKPVAVRLALIAVAGTVVAAAADPPRFVLLLGGIVLLFGPTARPPGQARP